MASMASMAFMAPPRLDIVLGARSSKGVGSFRLVPGFFLGQPAHVLGGL